MDHKHPTLRDQLDELANRPESAKGEKFEEWLVKHLPALPAMEVAHAWRWRDVPLEIRQRCFSHKVAEGDDEPSVDILAERTDGGIVAIQAKCHRPDKALAINSDSLGNFWSSTAASTKGVKLAARMVITTGKLGGPKLRKYAEAQGCALINAQTDWGDLTERDLQRRKPLQLDAQQKAAFRDCVQGFTDKDEAGRTAERGQLIMACGTGKTLVSLRVAERVVRKDRAVVLYATPSIALTAQSRRSWLANAKRPIRTLVICSDEDAAKGSGGQDVSATEIEAPVSTDPAEIATHLKALRAGLPDGGMAVVFATYQSLKRLCDAQADHGAPVVDFAIADEAHRTALEKYDPAKPRMMQFFHDALQAKKRLYQTATPRIYSSRVLEKIDKAGKKTNKSRRVHDMSDASIFGTEMHKLSFAAALKAKSPRLCDYKLVVLGVRQADMADVDVGENAPKDFSTSLAQRICALATAMQNKADGDNGANGGLGEVCSCIAFLNRVAKANHAAGLISDERLSKWARAHTIDLGWVDDGADADTVVSGSLSGGSDAVTRNNELRHLRLANADSKHVTANVQVLSEGVDVPALDAICFLEPRKNEVDIVQSVGRVMRRAPGKEHGYIIVPIILPNQQTLEFDGSATTAEEELEATGEEWTVLGQVLCALRAHDPRIETDLDKLVIVPSTKPRCAACGRVLSKKCGPCGGRKGNDDCQVCRGVGRVCPKCTEAPNGNGKKVGQRLDLWRLLEQGRFNEAMPVLASLSGMDARPVHVQNLIRGAVNSAASALGKETGLARVMMPIVGLADATKGNVERRTCIMAALTWMNALLVHQRITERDGDVDIAPLSNLRSDPKICTAIREAWRTVREHDYAPIFEPANALLQAVMPGSVAPQGVKEALQVLAAHAEECAADYAAMGMDHAGSLFNAAMDEAQSDGAYYTLPPGAQLLAELACDLYADEDDQLWASPNTWHELVAMDPACGSGTLLTAFAQAVRRRASGQGAKASLLAKVHKELVEHGMIGLDINPQAVQIAASQLVMGGLSAIFRNMGIWVMPRGRATTDDQRKALGPDDVLLGSLELLMDGTGASAQPKSLDDVLATASLTNFERKGAALAGNIPTVATKEVLDERLSRVGIVLTNPPFSTMANAASDLDAQVRNAMQMRFKKIKESVAKRHADFKKVLQADSMSPPFSFLVSERLHRERGVLGKVVPTTACNSSAPASDQERRLFALEFEIVRIITLHDPKRLKWSLEGHQESLLLMRRRPKGQRSKSVQFVSIRHFPQDADAAMELRRRILDGDMGDLGRICEWPRKSVEAGVWWPALFYEPALVQACADIKATSTAHPVFTTLGESYDMDITGQRLGKGENLPYCDAREGELRVCKSASEKAQQHIEGKPDAWVRRKAKTPQNEQLVTRMRGKAGRLLLACTQDAASGRLHAVALHNPVIGAAYMPVQGVEWSDAQALAVWLNSTPCRIIWRTLGSRRINWPMFKAIAAQTMPIPNPAHADWAGIRKPLLDAYAATQKRIVPQFREGECEVRRIWDDAAAQVLGVKTDQVREWAALLNAEPATSGHGRKQ